MKTTGILCACCLISITASAQLKLGAQAGTQVSTFPVGIARFGGKASALVSYELKRFRFSEQLGITVDRCSANMPTLSVHNMWQYVWADATTIGSYIPIRKERFDISLGSGLSVRRIISNTFNGSANAMESRMYKWSYFLPARVGTNFHLAAGREIACVLEYQVQVRDMYSPLTYTNPYDYTERVNKLHSVSLSVGYLFKI